MDEIENGQPVEQPVVVKAKKAAQPKAPKQPKGYEAILSAATLPLKLSGGTHASVANDVANNVEGLFVRRGNKGDWIKVGGKDSKNIPQWQKRALEFTALSVFMNPLSDSGSGYRRWVVKYSAALLEWGTDLNVRVQLDSKKIVEGIQFNMADAVNSAVTYEKIYKATLDAFKMRAVSTDKAPRSARGAKKVDVVI